MTHVVSYRGYRITVSPNGHGWRVTAHPMSPENPILANPSFKVPAHNADEAVLHAQQRIDDLLSG